MVSLIACSIDLLALARYVYCSLSFDAYLSEADEVQPLRISSSAFFLFGFEVCEFEINCRDRRYPQFFTLCGGTCPHLV